MAFLLLCMLSIDNIERDACNVGFLEEFAIRRYLLAKQEPGRAILPKRRNRDHCEIILPRRHDR